LRFQLPNGFFLDLREKLIALGELPFTLATLLDEQLLQQRRVIGQRGEMERGVLAHRLLIPPTDEKGFA
jgi:hypothetical protein